MNTISEVLGRRVQLKGLIGKRAMKCPYCDFYFMKNGSDLQRHIWAHEGACPSIRTELVCGFRAACGSSWGFPGGSVGKESACSVGDPGSILGLGRFPREGNGNPLQYSCLGNLIDRGAWWATVPWGHKESDTVE